MARNGTGMARGEIVEFDLHGRGMRVDDALERLERIVSSARARGPQFFAVVTGYGSSGGTSLIKSAVLEACRRYRRQNHIHGFLDGEEAADFLTPNTLAFPMTASIPARYRRSPNPGLVFICV